ncbi:MAG: hypothetical protein ACYTHK_08550 [Planctomycetota bacterium]
MRVLLLLALATPALADVTRPAYLGLTETEPGRFDVVWRVPRRGDRVLAIRARLPAEFDQTAPPTVDLEPDVQTTRWSVAAKPWELAGKEIAVEGPGTARVDVMVRFEFVDGTVVARILPPGTTSCAFPRRAAARSPDRELQSATWNGILHAVTSPIHLALLLALGLCGNAAVALLFFMAGQFAGLAVPFTLPHALIGVGAAVAAAAALKGQSVRAIALLCGVAHGSGQHWGAVIGMDAAGLVVALVVAHAPRASTAYVAGSAGIALAMISATTPDAVVAKRSNLLVAPTAKPAPASAPVAAATDAPLQLFVEVTPFETRVECVAKLGTLEPGAADIPVGEQEAVKERVRALFAERLVVGLGEPADVRVDFVTREAGGVLERIEPVPEIRSKALIGVAYSFATREPPERVTVRWKAEAFQIPAVIVDPRTIRTVRLDAANPELVWEDRLALPPVRAVAVQPATFNLSLISLALVGIGLALRRGFVPARILLAGACLTAPYAQIAIPMPGDPDPREVAEVSEALLTNLYRTLEQRDESAAYDRLGLSVTDPGPLYIEQRRMLELGRRGGARARVDSVEVAAVEDLESIDGGVRGRLTWEAGGFVVHYGHRHFRQNRYEAEFELVADGGSWKFSRFVIADKRRTR